MQLVGYLKYKGNIMSKLTDKLDTFKAQYPNYIIIYITITGSKLYGTNSPTSDTDYMGIFIPDTESILLKTDIDHWVSTTGNTTSKNSQNDVDIQLWSIHKFLNLVKKGETGALDLLFSLQRKDTQILTSSASDLIKQAIPTLLHKQVHSFIGYCIGQSKKYNIKGKRYKELITFIEEMNTSSDYKDIINKHAFKYISIRMAKGPRGSKGDVMIPYLSVLDKLFDISLDPKYIKDKLVAMQAQYGNRVKDSTKDIDYKALSHSVRVLLEVTELLETNNITFPLQQAEYIKSIKSGKESLDSVIEFINVGIEKVDTLMLTSNLKKSPNTSVYSTLLLTLLTNHETS